MPDSPAPRAAGRSRTATTWCATGLAALVLSACATAATTSGDSADGARLDARMLAMLDARQRDTVLVDSLLASALPERRARGALAVGQLRMGERYARLRRLLVDADTAVAANAAFALGLAQDSASVVALGRAVAGAPDAVAIEAAWALGQIGEPARAVVAFAIGEGLSQPLVGSTAAHRSGAVRAELLMATMKVRSIPPALVLPWLADTSVEAVRGAAYVFGRGRAPVSVRAMIGLRAHRDELVRQHVARALARSATGDSLATAARQALGELLGDASPRVRANAARSLATFGPVVRAEMERALRDGDAGVRVAAGEGIAAVFEVDAAAWQFAWDADTAFAYRRALATSAGRAGSNALTDAGSAWQRDTDWRRRAARVEARAAALQQAGADDRLRELEWALNDSDGRVRAAALGAIAPATQQGTLAPAVVERLQAALRDDDIQVRATATSVLARTATAEGLPAAIDAYQRALRDTDADARLSALRYIVQAWRRDSANVDAALRARLAALPPSREPVERAVVRAVSPMTSWIELGETRTPRPIAEYENIARRYLARGARQPQAVLRTERGDIRVTLYGNAAPLTVDAFTQLARRGFYKDTRFHRVVPNFVAQDGDPRGDGTGGAGFFLRDEPSRRRHLRGCLGVATSGPDTGGSQYYLCHSPQPHLDGGYTVFGQVIDGLDALDRIVQGDRVMNVEIR